MHAFSHRGGWWVVAQAGLMAAVVVVLATGGTTQGGAAVVLGVLVAVSGAALAVGGMLMLGRNLTPYPAPKAGTSVIERGPYRIVRHPIYGGIVAGITGLSIVDGNVLAFGGGVALYVLFAAKSATEERRLVEHVVGYSEYRSRVRGRILPFIR